MAAATTSPLTVLEGGCACGAVRFRTQAAAKRAGICHCLVCQQVHGAAFYAFAIFDAERVSVEGSTLAWQSSARYTRFACAVCGSRLGGVSDGEIELSLPSFDAPAAIEPQYEAWVCRRVRWLPALPVTQFDQDRISPA